jgi:hypothetical protein
LSHSASLINFFLNYQNSRPRVLHATSNNLYLDKMQLSCL